MLEFVILLNELQQIILTLLQPFADSTDIELSVILKLLASSPEFQAGLAKMEFMLSNFKSASTPFYYPVIMEVYQQIAITLNNPVLNMAVKEVLFHYVDTMYPHNLMIVFFDNSLYKSSLYILEILNPYNYLHCFHLPQGNEMVIYHSINKALLPSVPISGLSNPIIYFPNAGFAPFPLAAFQPFPVVPPVMPPL